MYSSPCPGKEGSQMVLVFGSFSTWTLPCLPLLLVRRRHALRTQQKHTQIALCHHHAPRCQSPLTTASRPQRNNSTSRSPNSRRFSPNGKRTISSLSSKRYRTMLSSPLPAFPKVATPHFIPTNSHLEYLGHAEQWGDVKHKKDKKAPTTATDKRTPAASPARGGWNLRGGRGGLSGGRGRGGAHGGGRGGSGHQNFTNGHQVSSRGKQSNDSGKHSTTATVLTTNGDAPKDTNVVAPVSVEGVADGLSYPTHTTSNTSAETPGTTDPCGTTDTAPTTSDPPKSAASPPAPRKVPGATGMSWAQIAKYVPLLCLCLYYSD